MDTTAFAIDRMYENCSLAPYLPQLLNQLRHPLVRSPVESLVPSLRTSLLARASMRLETYENCSFSDFLIQKLRIFEIRCHVSSRAVVRLLTRCNEIFVIVIYAQQPGERDSGRPKIDELEIDEFIEMQ
jgi:hypothetical protein